MSFEAMAWAAKSECGNSLNKLCLLMLANYANAEGEAYPSYKRLAEMCSCNDRTIMRSIKSLEELGMVKIKPRFTDSGKQTSNTFILCMRGDKSDMVGVTNPTPNTVRDIQLVNINKRGDKKSTPYCDGFTQWWKAYPRKDGSKKKAYDLWKRAITQIDQAELLRLTKIFARLKGGGKFTCHATTWLNQNRWETVGQTTSENHNRNALAG